MLPPLVSENYNKCAEVFQQGFGFTSSNDEKPYIATFGLGPCIAIVGYNKEHKIGFIYHIDNKKCFHDKNVGTLYYHINKFKENYHEESMTFVVSLFGSTTYYQKHFVEYIYTQIKRYNMFWAKYNIKINIVENNINTENNSTSVCLNTEDGSFYSFNGTNSTMNSLTPIERKCKEMKLVINSMVDKPILQNDYFGKVQPVAV